MAVIELDHVFCFVDPAACERLAGLDDGIEHAGQGTRNRRLPLGAQYLELLWLSSREDAERNPLRLDRRADWRTSGASPFGFGLRGQLSDEERAAFWAYRPPYAPEVAIWIHRTNEEAPERPFLFVMEASGEALDRMRARIGGGGARRLAGLALEGPVEPQPMLAAIGLRWVPAARPRLTLEVTGAGEVVEISEILTVTC